MTEPFAQIRQHGPLRSPPIPMHGVQCLLGLGPVLGDLCGALVEITARFLECSSDRSVHGDALPTQLRMLCHLLRERVLERVLELWV